MSDLKNIFAGKLPSDAFNYREPFVDPHVLEETAKLVNQVFKELSLIFPAFKQSYATETELKDLKKSWIKAFMEQRFCDFSLIERGLAKCRALETPFIPSSGMFIAMCKPTMEELGFPTVEEAYKIACYNCKGYNTVKKPWEHDAVRYAMQLADTFALANKPEKLTFPVFKEKYEKIITDIVKAKKDGRPLTDIIPNYTEIENRIAYQEKPNALPDSTVQISSDNPDMSWDSGISMGDGSYKHFLKDQEILKERHKNDPPKPKKGSNAIPRIYDSWLKK